jgi:hypothetical protein
VAAGSFSALRHHDERRPGRGTGQDQGQVGRRARALHVPYREDTYGLSRLITVSRNRCSTALSCVCHVVPKLTINRTCLRQASAPGWSRAEWVTSCAGIPSRQLPWSSGPGAGVHVVQPPGAPHGPLPLARSDASSPTRRDTCCLPLLCWGWRHTSRSMILVRVPRAPLATGTHGELQAITDRTH